MARKGGQNKNKGSDSVHVNGDSKKNEKSKRNNKTTSEPSIASNSVPETRISPGPVDISTNSVEENHSLNSPHKPLKSSENQEDKESYSPAQITMQIKLYILCAIAEFNGWSEKLEPHLINLSTSLKKCYNCINEKFEWVLPKVRACIVKCRKLWLVLFMAWLDCSIRGLDSLFQTGTASLFVLILCSFLSLMAMIGVKLMLLLMVIGGCIGGFLSLALALILVAISTIIILWFYGSFWITSLFILFGGVSLALRHEKIALFVTTIYAMYCAKIYVGWLGLFIGLNLAFISSDLVIHLIKKLEENRSSQDGNTTYEQDQDRGPGEPSTSGENEKELTSEEEIDRLLNCIDHYSVLGLPRFAILDSTWLKKEYRKKAMLVHPDKNLGNEKAAEAFKKLQNAYEVLLDSLKQKKYDDELRSKELLNYFRHFQAASSQKGKNGIFGFGPGQSEGDEGPIGELRRIICKHCGNSHIWTCTDRLKSRARWCQICKDFHLARDGDGWVEQSSQTLLFGLVQKMDLPCAYVCADSKIYDATEWFICQGMRCPPNTHKPSFHINTSVTKPSNSKGSSSNHRGANSNNNNIEEEMTEEEFFEWLQNAVNSGHFDLFSAQNDAPGGTNPSASRSGGKKKRRSKKQW